MERIPVGASPVAAVTTPDGQEVYVVNQLDHTVSVIEAKEHRVVRTLAVSRFPDTIVMSPTGKEVYIGGRSDGVTTIDTRTKQIRHVSTGGPVRDIAITPDGKHVYLALDYSGLKRYSTTDHTVSTIPTTHCPHALALDATRNRLWISYRCGGPGGKTGYDAIDVMDLSTERSVGTINGLPRVGGAIALSPTAAFVWADGWDRCIGPNYDHGDCPVDASGIVHVFRSSDNGLVSTLSFRPRMQANFVFAPDGSRVFLTQSSRFAAVDTSSFQERESLAIWGGRFALTGGLAYVPLAQENSVGLMSFSSPDCEPPSEGLTHFWPGDGVSTDLGEGRNFSNEVSRYAPGRLGQAFRFDGEGTGFDARLNNPWFSPFNRSVPQITLALWFKAELIGREQTLLAAPGASPWRLFLDPEGLIRLQSGDNIASSGRAAPNTWCHLVLRQTGNSVELFLNGHPSGFLRSDQYPEGGKELHLGWNGSSSPVMKGLVDEIVYYERWLSDREIQRIYAAPDCVAR